MSAATLAILGLLLLIVYAPALRGGFIWDDDVYVWNNPLLTAPDGLRRIWFSLDSPSQYFPLTYTSFLFEHSLWGFDTLGYHLVNLALHFANAALVWWILEALQIPGAMLAAAIFALHPVQVESVAWITERKNVLSVFFSLLTVRAWIKTFDAPARDAQKLFIWALMFFALALSAKTTACTLPAALVVACWLRGQKIDVRRVLQIAAFLFLGLAMGLLTVWWERHHQGAVGAEFHLASRETVILAGRALWFYTSKFFWPVNLMFSYPRWAIDSAGFLPWLWPASWVAAAGAAYWNWRRGRKAPACVLVFFAATLSPLLGFIPLYTFRYTYVADHYQYLALLAWAAVVGAVVARYARGNTRPVTLAICAVLGLMTWHRANAFADSEALWNDVLAKNPDSWLAHDNLACALSDEGRYAEAKVLFDEALELAPQESRIHLNLGNLYARTSRYNEAVAQYEESLRLDPARDLAKRGLARALSTLGRQASAAARYADAIDYDRRSLTYDEESAATHNNLGNALLHNKNLSEAVAEYERALALKPNFNEARFNLALAYENLGRKADAIRELQTIKAENPEFSAATARLKFLQQ